MSTPTTSEEGQEGHNTRVNLEGIWGGGVKGLTGGPRSEEEVLPRVYITAA